MKEIRAAILDLDGVITQTAKLHAKAWKQMFDQYNQKRKAKGQDTYQEFSIKNDYPSYVDGIPRYDGVRNFLASRGISLPEGALEDNKEQETIKGLGNWKNELFQKLIKEEKPEVYPDSVKKIKEWKAQGLKVAVISSSKNCKMILESVSILDLFDTRVDGITAMNKNLAGKPEPDIFLEAARELGINPGEAFIVEDAILGVEAGKKGGFKYIYGISRNSEANNLKEKGADQVISSLSEINIK